MSVQLQTTATIRQRGQLTIPDQIRSATSCLNLNSLISIAIRPNDELVIKPYSSAGTKTVNWKKIWEGIRLARSFTGGTGNLSKFIAEDRYQH